MESKKIVKVADKDIDLSVIDFRKKKDISQAILRFMDAASTSTARATAYNTKEEQNLAQKSIHESVFKIDRGLYGALLLLDGNTDHTKTMGVEKLLSDRTAFDKSSLEPTIERNILVYLLSHVPVQRMMKMYLNMKKERINNSRSKKIMLYSILGSNSIEYWSVKYKRKIRNILEHTWGKKLSSIIASILSKEKSKWNAKEETIIVQNVLKYVGNNDTKNVYECISFVFGNEKDLNLSVLKSYSESKTDITKGSKLPAEVLEGIRSTYHKKIKPEKILEICKDTFTDKERMQVQKRAEKAKVDIKFDPTKQELIELYIYSYANGMNKELKEAIAKKASNIASDLPVSYEKICIVLDASGSSYGSDTQKLRPLASSLAMRDVFCALSKECIIKTVGGKIKNDLLYPEGNTDIATPLLECIKENPQAIYIITDGYENSPAGRTNELVAALKKIGIEIPVYQISPVMSADAGGVKKLSEFIPVLPVSNPKAIGMGMFKAQLEADTEQGVLSLFTMTLSKLSKNV